MLFGGCMNNSARNPQVFNYNLRNSPRERDVSGEELSC